MYRLFKQNIKQIRLNPRGFTTFDMLIAVGLIAVLSALIVSNYADFRETSNLKAESEKMTSLIRKAQLWALSGQTRGGVRPPGGWGVHVDQCTAPPCRFFLFADMSPINPPNHTYDAGSDEIVSEFFTQQSVQIANVSPSVALAVDMVFTSPTSTGYINGAQASDQALITFYHDKSGQSQDITFDRRTNRVLLTDVVAASNDPQCSDGFDNDNDGYVDYPNDPDCDNSSDPMEYGTGGSLPPPPPVVVFEDTFEQNDLELGTYTPNIGTGWQQIISTVGSNETAMGGATLWASSANGALEDSVSGGAGSGALYQTIDTMSQSDYQVSAIYGNTGGQYDYSAIAARIQDSGDMYLFQWDQTHGQLFLRYGGAWLQLGGNTAGVSIGDEVRLRVYGNRIIVWKYSGLGLTALINEVNNTITDASPPGHAGVGLGSVATYKSSNANQRLDDFIVTENVSEPPPQCNDGLDNDGDGWTDVADGDCANISDDLEYTNMPQVIPVFFDDFNATADTVLDDGNYYTYVGPLFGAGWQRIISHTDNTSPPFVMTLEASGSNDRLQDGNICAANDGVLYRILDSLLNPNYEVTADYREDDTGDDYSVLAARIQDANNMYAYHWSTAQGQLFVASGGTWTQLGADTAGLAERDLVTLKVQGSMISVLRNGTPILSVTDTTHTSPGHAGLGLGFVIQAPDGQNGEPDCSAQYLDNFKVVVP